MAVRALRHRPRHPEGVSPDLPRLPEPAYAAIVTAAIKRRRSASTCTAREPDDTSFVVPEVMLAGFEPATALIDGSKKARSVPCAIPFTKSRPVNDSAAGSADCTNCCVSGTMSPSLDTGSVLAVNANR